MTPKQLVSSTLFEAGSYPSGKFTARWAYYHALDDLKGPFPAGEATIAADAMWACWYARDILKGPFPAGEAAIAKNAWWSYRYSKEVLKGPFPAGEKVIMGSEYEQDYIRVLTQPPEL